MIFSTESIVSLFPEFSWPLASYVYWAVFFSAFGVLVAIGWLSLALNRPLENPLNMPFRPFALGEPERCRPRWLLGNLMALASLIAGYYGKSDIFCPFIWSFAGWFNFVAHIQMTYERCQGHQMGTPRVLGVCTLLQAAFLFLIMHAVTDESAIARFCVKSGIGIILLSWFSRIVTLAQAGFDVNVWAEEFLCPASLRKNKKTK
jgi:hypothetical protein